MAIEKINCAQLVKLFYQNGCNSNASLNEYRWQKHLQRVSMSRNAQKHRYEICEDWWPKCCTRERPSAHSHGRCRWSYCGCNWQCCKCHQFCMQSPNSITWFVSFPWYTTRKVLRCNLHWYQYKIHKLYHLPPQDLPQCSAFALLFLALMEEDSMWLGEILWTDEAHFTPDYAMNPQNCRIWGSTPPHFVQEQPVRSTYVTMGCGLTSPSFLICISLRRWHLAALSDVQWQPHCVGPSLYNRGFRHCRNGTVSTPLSTCKMKPHHISLAGSKMFCETHLVTTEPSLGISQIRGRHVPPISFYVTSGCSEIWKMASVVDISCRWPT